MDLLDIKRRLKILAEQKKASVDASSKSLRAYQTSVHPLLLERMSQHFPEENKLSSTKGSSIEYTKKAEQMRGNTFIHYCLQSFYDQEDSGRGESPILGLKTSSKTLAYEGLDTTMTEEIIHRIESVTPLGERVADFRDVIAPEFPQEDLTLMAYDFTNSKLSEGIRNFLERNNNTFPVDDFVRVRGRNETANDLTMKEKYYPGRDDNRAYCVDRNLARSLAGSCLHRLICPSNKRVRRALHSSSILRPDNKDMLDLEVETRAEEDMATILIIGDISNFTGSFGNAWLMLYCITLELQKKLFRSKRSLFRVQGHLISASWLDVLIVYLYCTVGVGCWVESKSRFAFLPGGFLGVACNITFSLLMLAVIIQQVIYDLKPRVFDISGQAGGDDFALAMTLPREDINEICEFISSQVESYIGPLKEFEVYDLTNHEDGLVEGARFCKKMTLMERLHNRIVIKSRPTFPLPECLSPNIYLSNYNEQIKAWYELDLTLKNFTDATGADEAIANGLRNLFLGRYPRVKPRRIETIREWNYNEAIVYHEGHYLSRSALEATRLIAPLYEKGHCCFVSFDSILSQALSSKLVVIKKIKLKDELISVALLPSGEPGLYDTTRIVSEIFARGVSL